MDDQANGAGVETATAPGDSAGQALDALGRAYETLSAGGPVVGILLAMSVFAAAIILAKFVQFAALGSGSRLDKVVTLYRDGRDREALKMAHTLRAPEKAAAIVALEGLINGRNPGRTREDARRLAAEGLEAMGGWLRPLEVIAAIAPLLGLFGTVLGMIDAFAELEAAGSRVDPSILSGGIWVALLTTAVGLAVAIPTVTAFNWFERRIERTEHRLESALSALFASERPAANADAGQRGFARALVGE